jgi:hypothetical protein
MSEFFIDKDQCHTNVEMVKTGVYFTESIKWYNAIFLSSIITRSSYFIFAIFYFFIVYNIVILAYDLLPIKEERNIVATINNHPESSYLKYREIAGYNNKITAIISEFLIYYIKNREDYLDCEINSIDICINKKINIVRNTSSLQVSNKFNHIVKNSMINEAKKFINKTIEIEKVSFIRNKMNFLGKIYYYFANEDPPIQAIITAKINNINGDLLYKKSIYISYAYVVNLENDKNPIEIYVTEYSAMDII